MITVRTEGGKTVLDMLNFWHVFDQAWRHPYAREIAADDWLYVAAKMGRYFMSSSAREVRGPAPDDALGLFWHHFHGGWGADHDEEGYNKPAWKNVQGIVERLRQLPLRSISIPRLRATA